MRRVAVPQVVEANLGQGKPPNEIGEVVRKAAGFKRAPWRGTRNCLVVAPAGVAPPNARRKARPSHSGKMWSFGCTSVWKFMSEAIWRAASFTSSVRARRDCSCGPKLELDAPDRMPHGLQ